MKRCQRSFHVQSKPKLCSRGRDGRSHPAGDDSAATEVCSPLESTILARERIWRDCFSHAVANAVHSVHNEALSAYHWERIRWRKQPPVGRRQNPESPKQPADGY
jgi:hypothetical protein